MKTTLIGSLITALLKMLTPEVIKDGVDNFLDFIEDKVAKSPGKFDDTVVLPICSAIRAALNVPDED